MKSANIDYYIPVCHIRCDSSLFPHFTSFFFHCVPRNTRYISGFTPISTGASDPLALTIKITHLNWFAKTRLKNKRHKPMTTGWPQDHNGRTRATNAFDEHSLTFWGQSATALFFYSSRHTWARSSDVTRLLWFHLVF